MSEQVPLLEVEWSRTYSTETKKYTLAATVIRYEEIAEEVFVMQRDLEGNDTFYHIATVDQLVTLPASSPDPGSTFFRQSSMSLEFDTARAMVEGEDDLKKDLESLVDEWYILQPELLTTYTEIYTVDTE